VVIATVCRARKNGYRKMKISLNNFEKDSGTSDPLPRSGVICRSRESANLRLKNSSVAPLGANPIASAKQAVNLAWRRVDPLHCYRYIGRHFRLAAGVFESAIDFVLWHFIALLLKGRCS
jgi:hypothetical protein